MEKADFTAYGTRITDTVEPFWAHPLSISINTVQRVALWAKIGASPGMVGDSLWEVPVQEGVHPPQNGPQIPEENPLEAWSVQRQLVHELWSPGGDCATKAEGTVPWLSAPAGAHAPTGSATWKEGRQARVPPPWRSSAGDSAGGHLAWGKMEDRFGLCCEAPVTYPQPPPDSGWGRNSWASAPMLYTKHTRRRIVTISINKVGQIQPWQKREPSCWLQGREAHATPWLDLGLKSALTAQPTQPRQQQTASLHKHQQVANPLRQCTARKHFRKAWATSWKGG